MLRNNTNKKNPNQSNPKQTKPKPTNQPPKNQPIQPKANPRTNPTQTNQHHQPKKTNQPTNPTPKAKQNKETKPKNIGEDMPIIIWSKPNVAGDNICTYISNEYGIKDSHKERLHFFKTDKDVLYFNYPNGRINQEDNIKNDYIIVPSTHKSVKNIRCFTTHCPGNWEEADLGGDPKTLNWSYASFMKKVLMRIKDNYEQSFANTLGERMISYEVDHHGPTLSPTMRIPVIFVEIGSTEKEWNDEKAVKLIGDSIMQAIDDVHDEQPYFGIGGGHYAPRFTSLTLDHNYAFGHILPKYRENSFNEEMFRQAVERNKEGPAKVVIDWKGLTSGFRKRAIKVLDSMGVEWEKKR